MELGPKYCTPALTAAAWMASSISLPLRPDFSAAGGHDDGRSYSRLAALLDDLRHIFDGYGNNGQVRRGRQGGKGGIGGKAVNLQRISG